MKFHSPKDVYNLNRIANALERIADSLGGVEE